MNETTSTTPASITIFPASRGGTAGTHKVGDVKPPCTHPEHNAAGMVVREPGVYRHTCPGCGHTYTFTEYGGPQC